MNPSNVLMGDVDMGVSLPQADPDNSGLVEEKKMAKYSKTAEFKRIQEHFEAKKAYYQQFLPGNIPPAAVPEEERAKYWVIADVLIKEFNEVINMYETAAEAVKVANEQQGL